MKYIIIIMGIFFSFPVVAEPPSNTEVSTSEVGTLELSTIWQEVIFSFPINDPAVILGVPSANGGNGVIVQVKNVDRYGFEARINEWDYLDGKHVPEKVAYLALEQGEHNFGGLTVKAMEVSVDTYVTDVEFEQSFGYSPVILHTVGSINDEGAVSPRVINTDSHGFSIKLDVEEGATNGPGVFGGNSNHEAETVYVVAVELGSSDDGTIESGISRELYTHKYQELDFNASFVEPIYFFGALQTRNEADAATLRWDEDSLTDSTVEVVVQEETSRDKEKQHSKESIGWLVIGSVE